ncbi:hypothetical protein B0O99DRAFT_747650 [Bisporella sp. PMI_857]|nr:hypothetical protein B0O99DRAFT_747650 [Bisporella sp. PMI_857]
MLYFILATTIDLITLLILLLFIVTRLVSQSESADDVEENSVDIHLQQSRPLLPTIVSDNTSQGQAETIDIQSIHPLYRRHASVTISHPVVRLDEQSEHQHTDHINQSGRSENDVDRSASEDERQIPANNGGIVVLKELPDIQPVKNNSSEGGIDTLPSQQHWFKSPTIKSPTIRRHRTIKAPRPMLPISSHISTWHASGLSNVPEDRLADAINPAEETHEPVSPISSA